MKGWPYILFAVAMVALAVGSLLAVYKWVIAPMMQTSI